MNFCVEVANDNLTNLEANNCKTSSSVLNIGNNIILKDLVSGASEERMCERVIGEKTDENRVYSG